MFRWDFVIGCDNDVLAGMTWEAAKTVLVAGPTTEDVKNVVRIGIIVILVALLVKNMASASFIAIVVLLLPLPCSWRQEQIRGRRYALKSAPTENIGRLSHRGSVS